MTARNWIRFGIAIPAISAMLFIILSDPPRLPSNVANGTYSNPCCDSIELHNGQLAIKGNYIQYVIETDKGGAYVLPAGYVGVLDGMSVEFERSDRPLMLRLDDPEHPAKIELVGRGSSKYVYVFEGVVAGEPKL